MSTTVPVPTAPGPDGGGATGDPSLDARWYAAAVRSELSDLPSDVVEELAGGLEADLADLAAESSTPLAERLGPPRGYAAELRSAAGLAPRVRGGAGGSGLWARATEGVREDVEHAATHLRAQRWWPGAVERAALLRPAWWALRGALLAWLVVGALWGWGQTLGGTLVVLAGAAASVEVGRRRPVVPWKRSLVLAGNVLAVLVAPFALLSLAQPQTVYVDSGYVNSGPDTSTGVWVDGRQVTNLYPYDAQGRPLTGVQLLDDYGQPVSTTTGGAQDWTTFQEPSPLVPVVDAEGVVRWNAYPLQVRVDGGAPVEPSLPQPTLAPLLGGAAPTAGAPSASATPTELATATPSATATAGVREPLSGATAEAPPAQGTLAPTPTASVAAG